MQTYELNFIKSRFRNDERGKTTTNIMLTHKIFLYNIFCCESPTHQNMLSIIAIVYEASEPET